MIGLGRTGGAVALALRRSGVSVYGSDSANHERVAAMARRLEAAGASVDLGGHDLTRIASATGVVVSPGVPPFSPSVSAALNHGIEVWSEIDLALLSLSGCRLVGVTGTNGKTTTTALIDHLLSSAGFSSIAAGNIGLPLIDVVQMKDRPDVAVVELSSFQLHYSRRIRPTVGVLTNIQPDHLDWYDDENAYFADKKRLFLNADGDSTWIVNGDDTRVSAMMTGIRGRILRFSLEREADAWFDRRDDRLLLDDRPVISRAEFPLLGEHNVANALAAALAAAAIGVEIGAIGQGLRTAPQLEHRLEIIPSVDDVTWINDSKATNVASTIAALRAVPGKDVILIAGGLDKGEDLSPLAEAARQRCSLVIVFGASARKLEKSFQGIQVVNVPTLADAVSQAREVTSRFGTILLSPACASFDQFENYIQRGNVFRSLVTRGS